MISKELFNEVVIGNQHDFSLITEYYYPTNDKSKVYYMLKGNLYYSSINIYELAYKCKEWALKHKYYITEWHDFIDVQHEDGISDFRSDLDLYPAYSPEWTFKACQYILDNKDKQC